MSGFGTSDISLLLGTSADGALPTTADSRGASALAQLGGGGGGGRSTTGHHGPRSTGAGHADATEDVSQLTSAQAAALVRSRHATGRLDVGRTVKRHRADLGDGGGEKAGEEEEGVFNIGGGNGNRRKRRRKKKALQYKLLADQGVLKPEEQVPLEAAEDDIGVNTGMGESFAASASASASVPLPQARNASKPDGGYRGNDDGDEEDDAFATAAARRPSRKKAEAIVLSRKDRLPSKSRRHDNDNDDDSDSSSSPSSRGGRRRSGRGRGRGRGRRRGTDRSSSSSSSSSSDSEADAQRRRHLRRQQRRRSGSSSSSSSVSSSSGSEGGHHRLSSRQPRRSDSSSSSSSDDDDAVAARRRRAREKAAQKRTEEDEIASTSRKATNGVNDGQNCAASSLPTDEEVPVARRGDDGGDMGRAGRRTRSGSSLSSSSSSSTSSSSSSESSSSEDEAGMTPAVAKPLFVPKHRRKAVSELAAQQEAEEAERTAKAEKEKERRVMQSRALVAQVVAEGGNVNDNDQVGLGLDGPIGLQNEFDESGGSSQPPPNDADNNLKEGELERRRDAWEVRELLRILRDYDEKAEAEREATELERRRNMTDEERLQEDIASGRYRKPGEQRRRKADGDDGGGKSKEGMRYYHRGAFYMDEDTLKEAGDDDVRYKAADYAREATGDEKFDRSKMPDVMRVKKFGFAGQTQYKGLAKEDTTDKSRDYLPLNRGRQK